MARRRSSLYDREFVAMKTRLLARMMGRDPETRLAMDVVIVAAAVGADIIRVAEKTGVAIDQVRPLERRLREALLWNGRKVDAREWLHLSNYGDRMMVIFAQANVALGVLRRELLDWGAAYSDLEGNELVRFRISPESRVISRFPRPRVGFELSDLQ
jgi:hypothetical protein